MGFAGALAGAGSGLRGYSKILTDKRHQEFAAQQTQLEYERKMNLENLRARNQSKSNTQQAGLQLENQKEMAGVRSESQKGLMDYERGLQAGGYDPATGQEYSRQEMSALGEAEASKIMSPMAYQQKLADEQRTKDLDFEIEKTQKVHGATTDLQQKERESQWKEMEASGLMKGWSKDKKTQAKFAMFNPKIAQVLQKSGLSVKEKTELQKNGLKAYELGMEQWTAMQDTGDKEVEKFVKRVSKAAAANGDSPANFYASGIMYDRVPELQEAYLQAGGASGPGVSKVEITNPKQIAELADKIKNEDPTALQDMQRLGPNTLEKIKKINSRNSGYKSDVLVNDLPTKPPSAIRAFGNTQF